MYNVSRTATTCAHNPSFSSSGSCLEGIIVAGDSDICGVFMQRQQERFVFVLGKPAEARVHPFSFGGYKASNLLS